MTISRRRRKLARRGESCRARWIRHGGARSTPEEAWVPLQNILLGVSEHRHFGTLDRKKRISAISRIGRRYHNPSCKQGRGCNQGMPNTSKAKNESIRQRIRGRHDLRICSSRTCQSRKRPRKLLVSPERGRNYSTKFLRTE